MYKFNDLKIRLDQVINNNSDFSYGEKEAWRGIISELADYQEKILKGIAASSSPCKKSSILVHSGITSMNKNTLGKNYSFISVSDDINDHDFPNGYVDSDDDNKRDGDWYIIGTGYLDCSYTDVLKLCGREHNYTGKNEDGEFEYSLVLKNNILHHEKMFLELEKYYDINNATMYAPMLRRFVFIETKKPIKGAIIEKDLQLEINGLSVLKGGWRAIWNIECSDNPHVVKINKDYKYEKNLEFEYIIPIIYDEHKLQIKSFHDNDSDKDYILISPYQGEEPKKYIRKINISKINTEKNISENDIITYITPQNTGNDIIRIYSKSDIMKFLNSYKVFLECLNVYTKPQNNFIVCSYEKGFEYPLDTENFNLTGRPKLYVEFKRENDYLFYDRVIFITHLLQKKFPEYIWKGGYFK